MPLAHPSRIAPAEGPPNTISFQDLPFEIKQLIGLFIKDDLSLIAYCRTSRDVNNAIAGKDAAFWRARYRRTYDSEGNFTNDIFRQMYIARAEMLRIGTRYNFDLHLGVYEIRVIHMLRRLITESFIDNTVDDNGRPASKNQDRIVEFLLKSGLFNPHASAPTSQGHATPRDEKILAAVKLVCSQFVFQIPKLSYKHLAFDISQYAVYRPRTQVSLFNNGFSQVNLDWFIHNMNFFRHHMMKEEVGTLYHRFQALPKGQKPSAWTETPRTAAHVLNKYWRGTFGYIHERDLFRLRTEGPGHKFYPDYHIDEGKMETIEFDFTVNGRLPSGKELRWPNEYELELNSVFPFAQGTPYIYDSAPNLGPFPDPTPFIDINSIKTKSLFFRGKGADNSDLFVARGWINPLPPQGEIPGWSRFTMMKAYKPDLNIAMDNLWAYEGVVIPGNRIIMGRWWFASHNSRPYIGPFILWATEEPEIKCDFDTDFESDEEESDDDDEKGSKMDVDE